MIKKVEIDVRGKKLTIETGKMAKQADGAVVATVWRYGCSWNCSISQNPQGRAGFFPLNG